MIFIVTFVISFLSYYLFIRQSRKNSLGQAIREDGPQKHLSKKGTPTMGGIFIVLIPIIISIIMHYDIRYITFTLPFFMFGFIGFVDDLLIVKKGNNSGISAKTRIILEVISAIIFCVLYKYYFTSYPMYIAAFYIFLFVASSNACNLTDGIDGLLGSLSIIIFCMIAVIAYQVDNGFILTFSIAMISVLLAFLIFNFNPAKIFMGDTGSLSIGSALCICAIELKLLYIYPIFMLAFIFETMSVIIQVLYYKRTKKRIFLMAPFHHHLEYKGYSEKRIVLIFIVCQLLLILGAYTIWAIV